MSATKEIKKISETKLAKSKKNEMSQKILDGRINDINKIEKNIVEKIQNKDLTQVNLIKSLFSVSDTAKTQLERGGEQFTKADLIAIIIALDSSKISLIENLQKLINTDLHIMIRVMIYDTNRYMTATNNSLMNLNIQDSSNKPIKPPKPAKNLLMDMMAIDNSLMNLNQDSNKPIKPLKPAKNLLMDSTVFENKVTLFSKK